MKGRDKVREVRAAAPGRVNLIGEHTDYHDGFVLPCAVPQCAVAVVEVRNDRRVHASSAQMPDVVEYELGAEVRGRGWGDFIQGITSVLADAGFAIRGFDLRLHSDVPAGSGLSSSAALEVATLRALREAFTLAIDDVTLARLGQRAEVEFVGAPVGIMDQMASSLAGERHALFLDTRSLSFEQIPLPPALELIVINSGIAHRHAGGNYVTRRRESEQAAALLGVRRLRDVPEGALQALDALPATLARRARHVITENARVLRARDALRDGRLTELGHLFSASHASMRDDYEISIPEIDLLVTLAEAEPGTYGARLTGGGFGGSIVIAAAAGQASRIAARVVSAFADATGRRASVLLPRSPPRQST